jgi:hypothetical protein
MPERDFGAAFGMDTTQVGRDPDDFYHFRDNGSRVLAVAHLDTVAPADQRAAHFANSEAGQVVFSRALDDRLGAYIILHMLPALGITYDWLLTTGEEMGMSTADSFDPPKDYDWIIEFDRGGTDVVMYQYDDIATRRAVRASGARVGDGIFSDICYLEHLGAKGFNWGTGYQDYHGVRSHAFLRDTFDMVGRYLVFHELYAGTAMPHESAPEYGEDTCEVCVATGTIDPVTRICAECQVCQDCLESTDYCVCWVPKHGDTPAAVNAAEAKAIITDLAAAGGDRPASGDWDAEQGGFTQRVEAIRAESDAA